MLLETVNRFEFEPFHIDHLLDAQSRYRMDLDPQFPLSVKLFEFPETTTKIPLNWHERLEIFIPVEGTLIFRMGENTVDLEAGDILIVDNLKLHRPEQFCGEKRRAMAISFLAEWIYQAGSHPNDYTFLTPFYCQPSGAEPVLRRSGPLAQEASGAILNLLNCYLRSSSGPVFQGGCKAYLLQLLHLLARHFGWSPAVQSEYDRRRRQAERLGGLFKHLRDHHSEKVTIASAARLVGMSQSHFMKFFRQSTGTTLVSYLTNIRLSYALRLLTETDLPIAEIANRVGMPDQSYFDRKFKQAFRQAPRDARRQRGHGCAIGSST
jgi:AraC-like DNA-binding protein